jgi:hypothetical protein
MANNNRSFYNIDGVQYPRVTSILNVIAKPALVPWASNQQRTADVAAALSLYKDINPATEKMSDAAYTITLEQRIGKEKAHIKTTNEAMTIGTEAHARCEWVLQKMMGVILPEPIVSEKALWASMAAEDWIRSVDFKPVFIEQTVYSAKHLFAGTADFWGLVGSDLILGDFKTGKNLYPENKLQVSAYVYAFEEMKHGRAERAIILRLPKVVTDPAFEAVTVERDELDASFKVFLATKEVWEWNEGVKDDWKKKHG